MKNASQNIKMVFGYWNNVSRLIREELFNFSLLKGKVIELILILLSYSVLVAISGKTVDILIVQGYISDLEQWARAMLAIAPITIIYILGLFVYYPAKMDKDKQVKLDKYKDRVENAPKYIKLDVTSYPTKDDDKKVGIEIHNSSDETLENVVVYFVAGEKTNDFTKLDIPTYNRKLSSWDGFDELGKIYPHRSIFVHVAEIRDNNLFILVENNYEVQEKELDLFHPVVREGFAPDEVWNGSFRISLQIAGTVKDSYGKDVPVFSKSFIGWLRFNKNKMNWIRNDDEKWKKNKKPLRVVITMSEIIEKSPWQVTSAT